MIMLHFNQIDLCFQVEACATAEMAQQGLAVGSAISQQVLEQEIALHYHLAAEASSLLSRPDLSSSLRLTGVAQEYRENRPSVAAFLEVFGESLGSSVSVGIHRTPALVECIATGGMQTSTTCTVRFVYLFLDTSI